MVIHPQLHVEPASPMDARRAASLNVHDACSTVFVYGGTCNACVRRRASYRWPRQVAHATAVCLALMVCVDGRYERMLYASTQAAGIATRAAIGGDTIDTSSCTGKH